MCLLSWLLRTRHYQGSIERCPSMTCESAYTFSNAPSLRLPLPLPVPQLGDKTFFIAAILCMKHSRVPVFLGALSALVIMTVLSSIMGLILPSLMSKKYTHILAAVLFMYFGLKLLYESREMEAGKVSDELQEVEEEVRASVLPAAVQPERVSLT